MKKVFLLMAVCCFSLSHAQKNNAEPAAATEVVKTDAEWKNQLTPEQYEVLRNKGIEKPFTGKYVNTNENGTYNCAACSNPLFDSTSKFKSDKGYATFDRPIKDAITFVADDSSGQLLTEAVCSRCGGHLGHVSNDAPEGTSGSRFTISSVALKFISAK